MDLDGEYNYYTAKFLLVTFLVNNHDNEDDNKMAETWEAAFLDYLHSYMREHVNTTIMMSFSAEVQLKGCSLSVTFHSYH